MRNEKGLNKWSYLPIVFSSAVILVTQVNAAGPAQEYQEAKQVGSASYEYVGGRTQIGGHITDGGDVSADLNHIFSETKNSSSSVGLWAGVDLDDGDGVEEGGIQLNHNWVSRNKAGNALHVNKVFAAYDRNEDDHAKATVGYGQEREHLFWEGHVSKGLTGKKKTGLKHNNRDVSSKAYDYGVGGSIGTFLKGLNARIRAGVDHEWGDDVADAAGGFAAEDTATNTTLSAGIEKFFMGTPHSISLDVAASRRDGGTELAGLDDTDLNASLGYHYDFGGSIYQADREYRRVRVEIPGVSRPPKYSKQPIYKRVATYKNVPVYGKKTVNKSYKQLVKSTMELEGQTFFKLDSAKLIPSAQNRLKQIAHEIRSKGYRGAIRITGNTCGLGDAAYDQRLSEQRAMAVRSFLIKEGFNADHLIARGLGKSHPRFPNTPSQDFKNRRVDIEYVTESKSYKTVNRSEQVTVQTGTRRVATGFKNVPAGYKNVMIDSGAPGAPRVIWKTEAIQNSPAWIKRALRNNIKHDRNVNTYFTTAGSILDVPVTPINHAPEALDDNKEIECKSDPVQIDVLSNDTDADTSDSLTITSLGEAQYGAAVIENNRILYTPNANACGQSDKFAYTISDGKGETATANVIVSITDDPDGGNGGDSGDFPEGVNDAATTSAGVPVTIDVLANDKGRELTLGDVDFGEEGGTTRKEGNKIIYTPKDGFAGEDMFAYVLIDKDGNTNFATVTVTVTGDGGNGGGSDEFPEGVDDTATTTAGAPVTIDVLANDKGRELTLGDVDFGEEGGTTRKEGNKIIYTPKDGFAGEDMFAYVLIDKDGNTNFATVTVTVTGDGGQGNNTPVAVDDTVTTLEGKAVVIDVLTNDYDDDGDTLSVNSFTQGASGRVSDEGDGGLKYTPNANFTGDDSFEYVVSDGNGQVSTAKVTVTVEAEDNPDPIKVENDSASTTEGNGIFIDVLANDSQGLSITTIGSSGNSFIEVVNGRISYLPNDGFTGLDTFTYSVKDVHGQTAQATVSVTVRTDSTGPNRPPKANEDAPATDINTAITVNVLENDTDPDGDALTITNVTQPQQGSAKIVNNKIVYTPNGTVGSMSMTYTISDGNGHTDQTVLTISVTDPNDGNIHPPITINDHVEVRVGESILINVLANDTDQDGDTLILDEVDSGSQGITEKENNQIRYTPLSGASGTDSFFYGVHDGHGHNNSGQVFVTIIQ